MRMRLEDLLCHSRTQSVSQWVIKMDITSISMSLSLCSLHFHCTNSAPALALPISAAHAHLTSFFFLFSSFLSYPRFTLTLSPSLSSFTSNSPSSGISGSCTRFLWISSPSSWILSSIESLSLSQAPHILIPKQLTLYIRFWHQYSHSSLLP